MNAQKMSKRAQTPKAKDAKKTLKRLWYYLSYYKGRLILGLVLTLIANALSLVGPYLTGQMIGAMEITETQTAVDFDKVFLFAGLMVVFYLTSAVLNYFLSLAMVKIAQSVVYKLRNDLFDKMTKVSVDFFDNTQTGDIISRMSYDIDSISTSLAADLMNLITSAITLVVSFIMMLIISPYLILIFIVTIPVSFVITRILSKIIKRKIRARNQQLGSLNGYAEEMISAQKTIQSYVQEESIYQQFEKHNEVTAEKSYEAGRYFTIVGPLMNFINNLSEILVGTAGAILKVFGYVSLAQLASFMLYSRKFSGPINQMSNLTADIQSALAAAERIFYVLDEKDEDIDLIDAKAEGIDDAIIEFKDVSFSYDKKHPILQNVSFKALKGQTIAIVGHTGAGKTTLVNLLMRFYSIDSGAILVDDQDIKAYQRKYFRSNFSMVLQDTWLFKGTIFENIKYGISDASLEDVMAAAKSARIASYIEKLPEGYQTVITDDGVNISKGQKQLLIIARAMLSKSKILILDEATSNVDTYTEVLIRDAMNELMKDKTTFVIAHRLSTIKNADLILLMEHGNVIEQGTHEILIEKKEKYYELFMSQFN